MDEHRRSETQADEISTLIRQLREVEQRLQTLTDGEVGAVLDPETGTPIILQHARRELRRNRARFGLILDTLPAVVWTTDTDLKLTSVSGAVLSTLGVDVDDLIGQHLSDLERQLELSTVLPAHRQALEGDTASFEARLDGRFYDCTVESMAGSGGRIVGCVGMAVDVTPRVEMQRALEKSSEDLERRVKERTAELAQAYEELQVSGEEIQQQNEELRAARRGLQEERQRYQELFEFAPDGYVVTDEDGLIEEANQAASELLNVRGDLLDGKPLSIFVETEHQAMFHDLMNSAKAGGRTRRLEGELRLRPHHGEPFPVAVSVGAVVLDGAKAGLRWMVRDISKSRRLMTQSQRQRLFLERLMDVAPVGIALVRGEEHRFELANAYYRSIAGAKPPVVGRTFKEVFPRLSGSAIEMLDQVYRTAQAVHLPERAGVAIPGEGQTYWSVDVVPLQDLSGAVDGLLIIARDMSREVRSRKEIEQLALRIRRRADELRAVFDAMTDAVVVYDAQGVPIRANRAAAEAYGLDPVGADRHELAELLAIRDLTGRALAVDGLPSSRALRGEQVQGARFVFRNAKGEELTGVASAAPLGPSSKPEGAVAVWHDVTEREQLLAEVNAQRQRAEELAGRLQQERDKLQTIMENTHAQLAYLDARCNFVHVNTAYAEGSGHSREELIGHNHFDLFPHPENQAIFERAVETGVPVYFHGRPFVFSDQPERGVTYWDWSLVPVKRGDGEVAGLILSLLNVTERERLMQELDAHQARLNAIIENSPVGIVVTDDEARITLTNPAADEMYARRVPHGQSYDAHADLCMCYPDGTAYRARDLPLTRAALDGETHEDLELALIKPDGTRRDLLVSATPIRDRRGQVTGAIGVFLDITERKRTEAAVRQYAERLRVLRSLDQAILMARSAQEIAETSLAQLRRLVPFRLASVEVFDLEADETLSLAIAPQEVTRFGSAQPLRLTGAGPLDDLMQGQVHIVPDLREVPPSPSLEGLREQGVRSFVSLPLRARGELIGALNVGMSTVGEPRAEQMATMEELAQQVAIGVQQARLYEALQGYANELEERVATRSSELRASEARFRAIFEQSALGIALLDRRGQVMASNQALQEMLGRRQEELLGRRFTDFAHPQDDVAEDVMMYRELRDGERDEHRVETRYVRPDAVEGWANMVLSLVRDVEGVPQFIIAMVEDVTEQKRAHQALMESEKLATTGRLAASLAHEINNPLQTVIGCLGLAEESMEAGDDDVQTYVALAHDELKRTARIVGRLRDLGRPSRRERGEPTDLNRLIDEVLDVSRKDLKDHGIRVVRSVGEHIPRPVVMPDRIKQVILNLVLNARDAMADGGELTVSTTLDEANQVVVITVADQGPGIAAEVRDRLFDPFFSTKDDGTGLGLFVSQSIAQEHGGRIDVDSEVGQGSVFRVSLPV